MSSLRFKVKFKREFDGRVVVQDAHAEDRSAHRRLHQEGASRSRNRSSTHLRKVVHSAVPEVEETMKWSSPHFDYKGMFCGIAAFKEHVAFRILEGGAAEGSPARAAAVGGGPVRQDHVDRTICRATRSSTRILKIAKKLNDDEVKAPPMRKGPRPALKAPADLLAALAKNKKAKATFDGFPSRPAARIHRVGHRSQAGGHAREADQDRGRVDGRRQDPQLEVREVR